jgi:hypothetical protein
MISIAEKENAMPMHVIFVIVHENLPKDNSAQLSSSDQHFTVLPAGLPQTQPRLDMPA